MLLPSPLPCVGLCCTLLLFLVSGYVVPFPLPCVGLCCTTLLFLVSGCVVPFFSSLCRVLLYPSPLPCVGLFCALLLFLVSGCVVPFSSSLYRVAFYLSPLPCVDPPPVPCVGLRSPLLPLLVSGCIVPFFSSLCRVVLLPSPLPCVGLCWYLLLFLVVRMSSRLRRWRVTLTYFQWQCTLLPLVIVRHWPAVLAADAAFSGLSIYYLVLARDAKVHSKWIILSTMCSFAIILTKTLWIKYCVTVLLCKCRSVDQTNIYFIISWQMNWIFLNYISEE